MKTPLSILIVEDCIVMQGVIKKILIMSGLPIERIEIAKNGNEGIKHLKNQMFNLILIDINMPEMNGIQMIEELKEIPELRDIPILIVSADAQRREKKLFEKSSYNFIKKPFAPEELKKKVLQTISNTHQYNQDKGS
jgi:two-component system chemotaxis response regulator CheY